MQDAALGVRHLFSAAEAALCLGIPAGTVRCWASSGRLHPYGLDGRNRPLYDRDDLMALRAQGRDQLRNTP